MSEKHIKKEGDKGRAINHDLGKVVCVTYKIVPEYLSNEGYIVKNVMAGVCDETGAILVFPSQSSEQFEEARIEHETRKQR